MEDLVQLDVHDTDACSSLVPLNFDNNTRYADVVKQVCTEQVDP